MEKPLTEVMEVVTDTILRNRHTVDVDILDLIDILARDNDIQWEDIPHFDDQVRKEFLTDDKNMTTNTD